MAVRRSRLVALVASVVVHLAALALLLTRPVPKGATAAPVVIELELREAPRSAPVAKKVEPEPEKKPSAPAHPTKRQAGERRAERKSNAPSAVPQQAPLAQGSDSSAGPGAQAAADVPRAPPAERESGLILTPSEGLARRYGVGSAEGPGSGVTRRATDPVDQEARNAEERRVVQGRIREDFDAALGHARVEDGTHDPYFTAMQGALEKHVPDPPNPGQKPNRVSNAFTAAVKSWLAGAERFGRSGNPYDTGTRSRADELSDPTRAISNPLPAANQYQDFVDGKFAEPFVTVIRINQRGDGSLLGAQLLSSSGSKSFDQYALASVPLALHELPPAPKEGAGIHSDGLVTDWAFLGKLVYAQPLQGGGDAAYLLFGGAFEETTGQVYVNKIDKPKFTCRVRLLAVY